MLLLSIDLLTLCFPIAVIGPLTAFVYMKIVKNNKVELLFPFFVLLILAYLISFQMIALGWGHAYPGAGFGAYLTLPFVAGVTGIILLVFGRQSWQSLPISNREKIGYTIGAILILAFQLSAQFWFGITNSFLIGEGTVCKWLLQLGLSCG